MHKSFKWRNNLASFAWPFLKWRTGAAQTSLYSHRQRSNARHCSLVCDEMFSILHALLKDEMLLISRLNYILWFHQSRHSRLAPTTPSTQSRLILIPFIGEEEVSLEQLIPENCCIVECFSGFYYRNLFKSGVNCYLLILIIGARVKKACLCFSLHFPVCV